MTEGAYDIVCEQGATFERLFTITQYGVPFDLTGYTAKLQVRRTHNDRTALATLTSSPVAGMVIEPLLGRIAVSLLPTATATLPAVAGVYDLLLTETANGRVTRLLGGRFTITAGVTRAA